MGAVGGWFIMNKGMGSGNGKRGPKRPFDWVAFMILLILALIIGVAIMVLMWT